MLEQEDDIVLGDDGYPLTVADARETLLEKLWLFHNFFFWFLSLMILDNTFNIIWLIINF